MEVCFISKYPPIEGGISSSAYWLSRGLGRMGCKVFVVTNAYETESIYKEKMDESDRDDYEPENVRVFNTSPLMKNSFIPYFNPYTEKLANLAIQVIKENDINLIDSWYILPYGFSGFLVKSIAKKPLILRHAGSDMKRLFNYSQLNLIFKAVIQNADKIVTNPGMEKLFSDIGAPNDRIFLNIRYVDIEAFTPSAKPLELPDNHNSKEVPVITFIGKFGASKGAFELVEALSKIEEDFIFLVVSDGPDFEKLENHIKLHKLAEKTIFMGFVPPWKMPSVIKASTCVVVPERDFEVKGHNPILPREVMATGTCLALSEELYSRKFFDDMQDGLNLIKINPKNIDEFSCKIRHLIRNPQYADFIGKEARKMSEKNEKFESYVKSNLDMYRELAKSA